MESSATSQDLIRQLQQAIQSQIAQSPLLRQSPVIVQNAGVIPGLAVGNRQLQAAMQSTSNCGVTAGANPPLEYSYKVKIINPSKKSDVIVRQLNRVKSKFKSVRELRMKLIDEFDEQVPNTVDFTIGYFDGSQQAKTWLITSDDLETMYQKYPKGGNIMFWCDGRLTESESAHAQKRKRDTKDGSGGSTKRQEREEEVDSTYKELVEKHSGKYDTPKLRLWARMICSGLHDNFDNPPNIPAFSGSTPKRPHKQSLSDAISGAAIVFAETVKGKASPVPQPQLPTQAGVSPGKAVELRMKNYEQLRYLQKLFEDEILSEEEFLEQKKSILSYLRKL